MTDYPIIPEQDLILEAAIEKPIVEKVIPTGTNALTVEANKPSISGMNDVSIKSTTINQPESNLESPIKLSNPDSLIKDGSIEAAVSNIKNIFKNISTVTNNYIDGVKNSVKNSSNITKGGFSEIIKEVSSQYVQMVDTSTTKTNDVLKEATSIMSDTTNSIKTSSSELLTKVQSTKENQSKTESNNNSTDLILKGILADNKASKAPASTLQSASQKILNFANSAITGNSKTESETSIDSTTTNPVSIKNSKLIESKEVKTILAPDKTLEKSVKVLSTALPDAVNNLSTSVTSISPNSTYSNSVVNQGSKIDQSSSMTVNKPELTQPLAPSSTKPEPSKTGDGQMNEFYLQAIYAALMSGKVKVKLEYQ